MLKCCIENGDPSVYQIFPNGVNYVYIHHCADALSVWTYVSSYHAMFFREQWNESNWDRCNFKRYLSESRLFESRGMRPAQCGRLIALWAQLNLNTAALPNLRFPEDKISAWPVSLFPACIWNVIYTYYGQANTLWIMGRKTRMGIKRKEEDTRHGPWQSVH